jgi:hypothetical protein
MRLLLRLALLFAFCLALGGVAHAEQLANPDAPQALAALWPMLFVGIANLAGVAIPRLSSEVSFFHTTAGKALLTAAGAFLSAIPSAVQAHGLCWAMLAWAALGTVGTLTSALSPKAATTALLPLLLLPALLAAGCAHGTDGLRQGCANADTTIEGAYSVTGALIKVDLPQVRAAGDNAKLQRHEAAFGKTLGFLDSARSSKDAVCRSADAIDAGAKRDVQALIAQLVGIAADVDKAVIELKGALQ